MFHGQLMGIFVAGRKREDLQTLDQVEAVAGRGLLGDRYFLKDGTFSAKGGPDREVTLIEAEALDGLAREYQITLPPIQAPATCSPEACPSIISWAARLPSAPYFCAASACASPVATWRV